MDFLTKFIDGLDIFLWPLVALAIAATWVVFERFYALLFKYNGNCSKLMEKVQSYIIDNNIEQALNLCNSKKNAAINQVFKAALLNADRPIDEIQDHVEVASMSVVPKLQHRVTYIFTIANVATLIGLLGTIYGLVFTFDSIGAADASQKQALLSFGIASALYSTAAGLLIAIPCMLFYGYFFNRINTMIDEIDHYSSRLVMLLRTGSEFFENFDAEAMVTTRRDNQEIKTNGKYHNENNENSHDEKDQDTHKKAS
jgi:biopolymer transport protein ExbB/TolQ